MSKCTLSPRLGASGLVHSFGMGLQVGLAFMQALQKLASLLGSSVSLVATSFFTSSLIAHGDMCPMHRCNSSIVCVAHAALADSGISGV